MADTDMQPPIDNAADGAASAARRTTQTAADAGHQAVNAGVQTAQAGIDAEQRSFASAQTAGRQTVQAMGDVAQTSLKAGQDMARTSQEAARRMSDQATDFWRASLSPMSQLQSEFGRWVDQMWRQTAPTQLRTASPLSGLLLAPFSGQPLADMHETDTGLEISMELPGLKPQDIDLTLRGDALVVSGEKADHTERSEGAYRVSERRFGRFERSFLLPPGADRNAIEAQVADGLLKVTIGKLPGAQEPKSIPVNG